MDDVVCKEVVRGSAYIREHPKTIAAITLDGVIAAIVVKIGSAYLLLSAIP